MKKKSEENIKGLSWHIRMEKWHARFRVGGVVKHLGYFIDKQDAIDAINLFKTKLEDGKKTDNES